MEVALLLPLAAAAVLQLISHRQTDLRVGGQVVDDWKHLFMRFHDCPIVVFDEEIDEVGDRVVDLLQRRAGVRPSRLAARSLEVRSGPRGPTKDRRQQKDEHEDRADE